MGHIYGLFTWFVEALPDIANLILAVVGVLMSFPKLAEYIENRAPIRNAVALACVGLGVAGFVIGGNQRRTADTRIGTLVKTVSDARSEAKTQQDILQSKLNESLLSQGRMEGQLQLLTGAIKNSGVRELIALVNNLIQPPSLSSLSPSQLCNLAIGFAQRLREVDQQHGIYIQKRQREGGNAFDWQMMYDKGQYTRQFREIYLKDFLSIRTEILRRLNRAPTQIDVLTRAGGWFQGGDATRLANDLEGLAQQLPLPAEITF